MKRFFQNISVVMVALVAIVGCRSNDIVVEGRFVGLNFNKVYLEKSTATGQSVVDSIELDTNGAFHFRIDKAEHTPMLYNVIYGGDRIPLLLSRGERVEVSALGNALANDSVKGSSESQRLRNFVKAIHAGQRAL